MAGKVTPGKQDFQVEYTPEKIAELCKKFEQFIENEDIPIVVKFAYLNRIPRETLYEIPELKELTKRCIMKKEYALEEGGLTNKLNNRIVQFSLSQIGWSNKQEVELTEKRPIVADNELLD